ncbi:activator of basal transcription 1-like [Bradysia coprophila]|uniref:activator of basal transcription 1-like n=1 Tax=Bradysia coprophila TaxID=38358 RepID=UPI00187DBDA6|nr:activator of basal transcription 1-like [Bradysia coprophila]
MEILSDKSIENESDGSEESADESMDETEVISEPEAPKKKKKRGIVYISSIPKFMTVAILREQLGRYASIGRVYLQAAETKENAKKRKIRRHFTEGWVEFESKRAAKQIAASLNNAPIATRKSSKFCDILWCLKYLPRFKWTHLSERLTYEKAVYNQRLKTEVAQARREATFFQDNLDKSERIKKKKKKMQLAA